MLGLAYFSQGFLKVIHLGQVQGLEGFGFFFAQINRPCLYFEPLVVYSDLAVQREPRKILAVEAAPFGVLENPYFLVAGFFLAAYFHSFPSICREKKHLLFIDYAALKKMLAA